MKSSLKEINGRYYMPAKVVMLSTKESNNLKGNQLWINIEGKLKLSKPNSLCPGPELFQHLYITSDEEVKEGDYFIGSGIVGKRKSFEKWVLADYEKVIASTHPTLGLPQPSQSFIKAYIEAYNSGNVITDVLVEYVVNYKKDCELSVEECKKHCGESIGCELCFNAEWKSKLDSDNTITIKKVKECWSREEVEKLLFQYDTFILNYHTETQGLPLQKDIDKWIDENL